jgi:hypothetical protein
MITVTDYGIIIKGKETSFQIQQVTTRDNRKVLVCKVTKPVYNEKTKQFSREDVSEPFWIDSVGTLIDALADYRNMLDERARGLLLQP